jgi:hypothetical protein
MCAMRPMYGCVLCKRLGVSCSLGLCATYPQTLPLLSFALPLSLLRGPRLGIVREVQVVPAALMQATLQGTVYSPFSHAGCGCS